MQIFLLIGLASISYRRELKLPGLKPIVSFIMMFLKVFFSIYKKQLNAFIKKRKSKQVKVDLLAEAAATELVELSKGQPRKVITTGIT